MHNPTGFDAEYAARKNPDLRRVCLFRETCNNTSNALSIGWPGLAGNGRLCYAEKENAAVRRTVTQSRQRSGTAGMERIFLLEDDAALGRGVAMALERPERQVKRAETLAQAQACLAQTQFDLLILDLNLPDGSGLTLLRALRDRADTTPVILLTANDLEIDEVTGLEAGADDYITKPFSLAILRARVDAQLRRGASQATETALLLGPFRFDFEHMDFRRAGVTVELSKAEQKLLRVLVDNRGHAVSRATLVDRVWTDGAAFVEENALSVTVKRLRSKLEADPAKPEYLKTVYGIGYLWAVEP